MLLCSECAIYQTHVIGSNLSDFRLFEDSMYRKNQMARVNQVAHLIHNEPRKWTRSRLAVRFKVNITTWKRGRLEWWKVGRELPVNMMGNVCFQRFLCYTSHRLN